MTWDMRIKAALKRCGKRRFTLRDIRDAGQWPSCKASERVNLSSFDGVYRTINGTSISGSALVARQKLCDLGFSFYYAVCCQDPVLAQKLATQIDEVKL